MIQWSLYPEYATHKWDGDVDPLDQVLESLAAWVWTAVESATGTGKTFLGACIVLWFLECFENSLVVTTAPKHDQLQMHIWREIGRLHPAFRYGELLQSLKLRMKPPGDDWAAIGFVAGVSAKEAASSATRAQGFHAEHMLIITEETPGIAGAVMTAFQGTCISPHNLILAFGNPDHQQDTLHQFAEMYKVRAIRISGFDHPNVVCKNPLLIPGAQSQVGLERLLNKYKSETFPLYMSRARGLSPEQAKDAVIRYEWCKAAGAKDEKGLPVNWPPLEGLPAMGVDVANSEEGDQGAIARGKGSELVYVTEFPCPDSNKLGERVFLESKELRIRPEDIGIDGIGVGAGTVNKLKELGAHVQDIQSGGAPIEIQRNDQRMVEQFDNLRSQMWWQMRVDLQFPEDSHIVLPDDDELFADLCTPKWTINKAGKIQIEAKDQIRKRLGRSPNKGDAAVYWNWARKRRMTVGAAVMEDVTVKDVAPEMQRRRIGEQASPQAAVRRRTW